MEDEGFWILAGTHNCYGYSKGYGMVIFHEMKGFGVKLSLASPKIAEIDRNKKQCSPFAVRVLGWFVIVFQVSYSGS